MHRIWFDFFKQLETFYNFKNMLFLFWPFKNLQMKKKTAKVELNLKPLWFEMREQEWSLCERIIADQSRDPRAAPLPPSSAARPPLPRPAPEESD